MLPLPKAFLARMQVALGSEFSDFLTSYQHPPVSGLRVNTLKITPEALRASIPLALQPVPWCPSGYRLTGEDSPGSGWQPGKSPLHASGLYYLQEPAAMAVVEVLDPQPGEWVLDLAAAPGGKSTHIASKLDQQGVLVANEIHSQRVWELAENLERWGVQNAVITNETADRLADQLGDIFDKVLVDAPCSGEGMFRKLETARSEWSPQLVSSCALRQNAILNEAARLVRPGGRLVYSTCTFAAAENEGVIDQFLTQHTDFEPDPIDKKPGMLAGRPDWLGHTQMSSEQLVGCTARLWPHHSSSEGHFLASLKRTGSSPQHSGMSPKRQPLNVETLQSIREFSRQVLIDTLPEERFMLSGTYLYLIPPASLSLGSLRVIHPGWWIGSLKTGRHRKQVRFEPAHALALGLQPNQLRNLVEMDSAQSEAYLRGESLRLPGPDGWTGIVYEGYLLGWSKRSQGVLKNAYPKGLRWV